MLVRAYNQYALSRPLLPPLCASRSLPEAVRSLAELLDETVNAKLSQIALFLRHFVGNWLEFFLAAGWMTLSWTEQSRGYYGYAVFATVSKGTAVYNDGIYKLVAEPLA